MTLVLQSEKGNLVIPDWVRDLATFRKWRFSDAAPEKLKVHFLNGEIWLDDSHMEELFTHNQVKAAIYVTLGGIATAEELGLFIPDGMLMTNDDAMLSTEPDAMFVAYPSIETQRVKFGAGRRGGRATEILGSPDLVIEVVSPSSVDKDTEKLISLYHDAEIPEYWLVDVRDDVKFDIFRRTATKFVATKPVSGWVKSRVFGRSFRLTRHEKTKNLSTFTLDVQ